MRNLAKAAVVAAILPLSGCGALGGVVESAGKANDAAIAAAEVALCDGASIASVRRRYGGNQQLMQSWFLFCTMRMAVEAGQVPIPTLPEKPGA